MLEWSSPGSSDKPRTVKLLCPSLSKVVAYAAWEEQRLDLGSIARVFGLDPSTLKLNGHFISRGVDLVSSSVTWRSLLNFFSAKGLSTGKDDEDALIVNGKLSKVGNKRAQDIQYSASRILCRAETVDAGGSGSPRPEEINLLKNKKLKGKNGGCEEGQQVYPLSGLGIKRKQLLVDVSPVKKLKTNEADSDFGGRGNNQPGFVASRQFKCSYTSDNAKRMRDEVVLAAPCKRMR